MNLDEMIKYARGEKKADLLLTNARIVNVFSGEIIPGSIAIAGGYIAGFGSYPAKRVVDMKGRFVAPGFIDAHVHIESSMSCPTEFARCVLPHGTTTVAADPHEIANVLGAEGIGYMIERLLRNVLYKHGIKREVVTLVTMALVKEKDPAFERPSKRVGKIYNKEEADRIAAEKNWIFKEDKKREGGYRRVVPSPAPIEIINEKVIEKLARQGSIVVASGGGGVPVYRDAEGRIRPSEAVIDKDLASALLGARIGANEFYILTDVPFVYKNYGKEDQETLEFLNIGDTKKLMEQGIFGEGSMAPKIKAAMQFVELGGEKSIITESKALADKSIGTKITKEYDQKDLHKYDK